MNITQAFIENFCGGSNSNHTFYWICGTIFVSCIMIFLIIRMILKYLKDKQIREEQQEMKILENKISKDDFACINNKLCEIHKTLIEIKSEIEPCS